MRLNADFQSFVGLVDGTRECSVFFPAGPLGISLIVGTDGYTEVSAIKMIDGRPSPALINGLVAVGDKVSKLNGDDVLGSVSHDVLIVMIKSAPRPLLLHFVGNSSVGAAGGAGASSALPPVTTAVPKSSSTAANTFDQKTTSAVPALSRSLPAPISSTLDEGSGLFDAI